VFEELPPQATLSGLRLLETRSIFRGHLRPKKSVIVWREEDRMRRNALGGIVTYCWNEIPSHFPCVALDAFVVMPNHIHGILVFTDIVAGHARPLPVVIGSFKSAVSKRIGTSIWQRSYWDRIIRNEEELNLTRHYVEDNPLRWPTDKEYIA
jgi:putative transposase